VRATSAGVADGIEGVPAAQLDRPELGMVEGVPIHIALGPELLVAYERRRFYRWFLTLTDDVCLKYLATYDSGVSNRNRYETRYFTQ
jgi:hypothetical protein